MALASSLVVEREDDRAAPTSASCPGNGDAVRFVDALLAGLVPAQDRNVRILLDSGRMNDADIAFDQMIASSANFVAPQWNRATVLVHRATLAWRLNRISLSLELAAEGWTELDLENPSGAAAAHTTGMLGYLQAVVGRRRTARQFLRLSTQLAREAEDEATLAHCLTRKANVVLVHAAYQEDPDLVQEDFELANQLYEEALTLPDRGQPHRTALAGHARALAWRGSPKEAIPFAEDALRLSEENGDMFSGSLSNWALAASYQAMGSRETARTYFSRALESSERIHEALWMMRFSLDLASMCAELGDSVGESVALRRTVDISKAGMQTLQEGLGQALEQRRVAVQAQRLAVAAQEAAIRDSLTGLVNRLGLQRNAPRLLELAEANNRVPWLLMIDLDQFKGVNDRGGHTTGDAVLQEMSQILRRECRADDLLCRWAGDEFVVLLLDATEEATDAGPQAAERIRAAVSAHDWRILLANLPCPLTVSIGVAAGPATFDHLFAAADLALYRAKHEGRNRIEVDQTGPSDERPTIS